ncbi:MAG: leucyl/phenylalanyl-tRNA--protein transferase [Burkholderiales bacterium]|nr:leucyl/phenylalanyl-tRNA--protein transferase [Burkholderiales bacterium]
MIPWLQPGQPFPPAAKALRQPNGLLAASGEITPERILDAYSHGIFPWYSEGEPVLWWSPDPRMVLVPDQLRVTRSLAKTVRSGKFEIRFDTAFERVMRECAAPREGQDGTWIVDDIARAYTALHERGFAHSVESWRDGELVGGLYGVALPRMFFGESMFARETDASKVALVALVGKLKADGFGLIDCQQETRHLASLGAAPIPRAEFVQKLRELIHFPLIPTRW